MRALQLKDSGSSRLGLLLTLFIVGLSSALRLWGLKWGLPNELHDYSYHPDEFLTIGAAFGVIYLRRTWNPGFFNYPSLFLYLSALVIAIMVGYGASVSPASVYLWVRAVSALMGVCAVWATLWAGTVLFERWVGLLAGLVICVAPIHVQHSHFATVDVPSTLFVALALGYSGLILQRHRSRDYILAGAMAGLAAGTKYNAGIVILSAIGAHLASYGIRNGLSRFGYLAGLLGSAAVAFVVSTPGCVLARDQFVHGLLYEARHSVEGHGLVFAGTGNGFFYTLWGSIVPGLGVVFAALFLVSVFFVLTTRNKPALSIIAFVIPYYVLISLSQVRFARYALPLVPSMAILIAWTVSEAWQRFHGRRLVGRFVRISFAISYLIGVLLAMFTSIGLDLVQSQPDPRDQAARWVHRHIALASHVGVIDWPWFYSPPFEKSIGFGALPQRQNATRMSRYRIKVLLSDKNAWKPLPRWVVVSDYEVEDALRLKRNRTLSEEQHEQVERINWAVKVLQSKYRVRAKFGGSGVFVRWHRLPHDMRYVNPRITIYEMCELGNGH